jgi:hypothetical protein
MFEGDCETLKLIRLQRLRDKILHQIQYGLKEADRGEDDENLIRELELKVEEAKMVSHEISQLIKQGEINGTANN